MYATLHRKRYLSQMELLQRINCLNYLWHGKIMPEFLLIWISNWRCQLPWLLSLLISYMGPKTNSLAISYCVVYRSQRPIRNIISSYFNSLMMPYKGTKSTPWLSPTVYLLPISYCVLTTYRSQWPLTDKKKHIYLKLDQEASMDSLDILTLIFVEELLIAWASHVLFSNMCFSDAWN